MPDRPLAHADFALPTRRADLTVHELDGEALIYDPVTADTHRLNSTALFIWRCCDGHTAEPEISNRITESYDVTAETAAVHVRQLIAEFEQHGLLASAGKSCSLQDENAGHATPR